MLDLNNLNLYGIEDGEHILSVDDLILHDKCKDDGSQVTGIIFKFSNSGKINDSLFLSLSDKNVINKDTGEELNFTPESQTFKILGRIAQSVNISIRDIYNELPKKKRTHKYMVESLKEKMLNKRFKATITRNSGFLRLSMFKSVTSEENKELDTPPF